MHYDYDGQGDLATTRYAYDGAHRLIIITDAKGNTDLQDFYGPGDRILRHIQAVGNEYRFWYAGGWRGVLLFAHSTLLMSVSLRPAYSQVFAEINRNTLRIISP